MGVRDIDGLQVAVVSSDPIPESLARRHCTPERSTEHPQPLKSESHPGRALTVREIGALPDLDNVTVRIADVAANLAVLGDWLCDELGSSTFPQFIARLNIRNAEIHKAVDVIRVGDAERYRRLIRGRPAPNVQNHPDIRKLKVPRRVAVAQTQNASAENLFVVVSRSLDVGDGEKLRDADPLSRGHLIALLFDLYGVRGCLGHSWLQDGRLQFRFGSCA